MTLISRPQEPNACWEDCVHSARNDRKTLPRRVEGDWPDTSSSPWEVSYPIAPTRRDRHCRRTHDNAFN